MLSITRTDIKPAARPTATAKSQGKGHSRGQLIAFMVATALLAFVVVLLIAAVVYTIYTAV